MVRPLPHLLLGLQLTEALVAGQQTPTGPAAIFREAAPAVVLIEMRDRSGRPIARGTGFIVQPEGTIVTCLHVIQCAASATVRTSKGDAFEIRSVLAVDKLRDLAIVSIPAVDLPVLRLGRSSTVTVGQTVYTISNVLGALQNTFSQGIVSARRQLDGHEIFQVTTMITEGSSGAPLLDEHANVVGVLNARIPGEASLNFAIPIDYVRGLLAFPSPTSLESLCTIDSKLYDNPLRFFKERLNVWTLADAEAQLGTPARVSSQNSSVLFNDASGKTSGFLLLFDEQTGLLLSAIIVPKAGQSFREAKRTLEKVCNAGKRIDRRGSVDFESCGVVLLRGEDDRLAGIGVYSQ